MDISDILTQILPKDILPYTIIYGFVYFLLIFYGTEKQWGKYSSFEKTVFSAMSGGFVWFFFIFPISYFLASLVIFQKELVITDTDLFWYAKILYFIILLYLLIWRLIFSNRPLRDNNTFFEFTKLAIKAIWYFLVMMNLLLYAIIISSEYREYVAYPLYSFIYSFLFVGLFYSIFLEIYGEKIITSSEIDNFSDYLALKIQSLKSKISINETLIMRIVVLVFIILIIFGLFTGKYLTKTTTQIVEKTERLVIDEMYIHPYYWQEVNISGDYQVEQNYSIKFGLIPWTKIRPNITLRDGYNVPTNPNYNFMQNSLYINNSWLNTTNIILRGIKEGSNIPKFYTLKIIDLNETTQRWDIEFNNIYSYPIEIYYLTVYQPPELKYIKYEKSDGLSLNEVVMENSHTIIKRVTIHPESDNINPNQSITLYFEKYSK